MNLWTAFSGVFKRAGIAAARKAMPGEAARNLARWLDGTDTGRPISPADLDAAAAQGKELLLEALGSANPDELRAARQSLGPILRVAGKPSYKQILEELEWTHPAHVKVLVIRRAWTHRELDCAFDWLSGTADASPGGSAKG